MNRRTKSALAILFMVALAGCGDGGTDIESVPVTGRWMGFARPAANSPGMEMAIVLQEGPDGALSGEGDVRLTGGGGSLAEVITIANGVHRPPEVSFVLTNGVVFVGEYEASGPSISFRTVPSPTRTYASAITLQLSP